MMNYWLLWKAQRLSRNVSEAQIRPSSRPNVAEMGSANFVEHLPALAKVGPRLAKDSDKFAVHWPTLGRFDQNRPVLVECWSSVAEVWSTSTPKIPKSLVGVCQTLANRGKTRPRFGQRIGQGLVETTRTLPGGRGAKLNALPPGGAGAFGPAGPWQTGGRTQGRRQRQAARPRRGGGARAERARARATAREAGSREAAARRDKDSSPKATEDGTRREHTERAMSAQPRDSRQTMGEHGPTPETEGGNAGPTATPGQDRATARS